MKKATVVIFTISILFACCTVPSDSNSGSIKVASFNIQIFGQTKAGNAEVMDILGRIIREFDIVAIQEIRDAAETAIIILKDKVNENGRVYDVVTGSRVGRTSSKEQYAYMYDTEVIELLPSSYTFDDDGDGNDSNDIDDGTLHPGVDLFEREPFIAHFKVKGGTLDFVLINIHTKPDDATAEIGYLPDVFDDVPPHISEADIICLGDFNADGSYFDEDTYASIFPSTEYNWLIVNDEDTTVAVSDNTYDRIVTTLVSRQNNSDQDLIFLSDSISC